MINSLVTNFKDEVIEAMYDLLKKLRKEEDGQSLVMVALLFVVLLGFSALVIDVGMLYVTKAQLQNAADAGALAGAAVPLSDTIEEAEEYARTNGVNDSVLGTTITVNPNITVTAIPVNTTGSEYTSQELEEVRAELIAELNLETDASLIEMASDDAVTTGLMLNTHYKYTSVQIAAFDDLSDSDAISLANNEEVYDLIKDYVKKNDNNGLVFQNDNQRTAAMEIIKTTLAAKVSSTDTTIGDRAALIMALVNNMISEIGDEVLEEYENQTGSSRVSVRVTKKVTYTFAKVLGLTESNVSAYAVAERGSWNGDALPFINLDGNAENSVKGEALDAWNKVDPGDKERISNDDLLVSSDNTNIKVNYEDGSLTFKKGKVMSKISNALDNMLVIGKTVYLYSLKFDEMSNYSKGGSKELKNGDLIPLSDIVLLECKVTDWDGKLVGLEYENSYYYDDSLDKFISNMGDSPSSSPKLVE